MKSYSVMLLAMKLLLISSVVVTLSLMSSGERPAVISVGAAFPFNSTIGRVAKIAIQAGVDDVNSDQTVLRGSKLVLTMQDIECDCFLGMTQALKFMESNMVAMIGPQWSWTAQIIFNIANKQQVPLLSYGSTDPTLSTLQFPYLVRTTQSDSFQMQAIAEIIDYYQWRQVIAIFIDHEYGRNGISALGDKLAEKRCKITFKAALPPEPNIKNITDLLIKVGMQESRIIVLHANPAVGITVFSVANSLGMMQNGYVWIATDWLVALLDSTGALDQQIMDNMQGVLSLRMHTANSARKVAFESRWSGLANKYSGSNIGLHSYGLCAYDSVWVLARALDAFFTEGGSISFSNASKPSVSDGGKLLLDEIKRIRMEGLTGLVQFDQDGNLIHPAYDIVNVVGSGLKMIGYWSNYTGLSIVSPEKLYTMAPKKVIANQMLSNVIWPGDTVIKPRGWVFANSGKELRIGVPNRVLFQEFLSKDLVTGVMKGYCIDVFTAAVNLLDYPFHYNFIPFGDGQNMPDYQEILHKVAAGEIDGAVGDFAIVTNRTQILDFTQPYIESGLVIVVPLKKLGSNAWAFSRPFTLKLWCATGVAILLVGVVVWILERRVNEEFHHSGNARKQIFTIFWFGFSSIFSYQQEEIRSTLGRIVMTVWLFVVLIIQSSYTASLTSILTVQQLSSSIRGIDTLIASGESIGVAAGSFAESYLVKELNIPRSRLKSLASPDAYVRNLELGPYRGGVAAVVEERPYVDIFLSTHCQFTIVGSEFTQAGWGFAFPRDSLLAVDVSTAILKLSENGELQNIHDKWLRRSACSSANDELDSDQLRLSSFWGLFLTIGSACFFCQLIYLSLSLYKYIQCASKCSLREFLSFLWSIDRGGEIQLKS